MTSSGSRLSTNTPYIKDLNAQINQGEIKVPKFQRPFVWDEAQALALLDSLRRNYPIGSLLLWRTTQKLNTERDLGTFQLPSVDDISPTEYILDGQQRATVLYSAFGAAPDEPGFKAAYDLKTSSFVSITEVAAEAHQFPLRWLYQTTPLLNFRTALQSLPDSALLQERLDAFVDTLTGYKIPVVTLRDLSLEEVAPIFERINSSGTELSIFDLMVAATWSDGFDLNDKVDEISVALQPKNFGDIRGNTVLKCLAAVESNSVTRDRVIALRKLAADHVAMNALVDKTKSALLRAADQLITEFRIYSLDFLPYEAHLLILTHIFSSNTTLSAAQMKRLRQWFWRTSFSERYRGTNDAYVTRDLELVRNFIENGVGDATTFGATPLSRDIKTAVFRKNNSRSRAFSLALAKAGPENLTNGSPIDTAVALSGYNKKQFHHIYPDAYLRRQEPSKERNLLLNMCMLAASENNLISDDDPHDYLVRVGADHGGHAEKVFKSNLLPNPSIFTFATASYDEFLEARLEVVQAHLALLCDGDA
ncbi:GmrSD restriction endonuclease domain-containing protein [Clavibacter michiganensis]|uniref:GmrSD restriction endonuclease domain-containing protein n=1 Tax=Clavibacter michiganensis TaxID=28447 RepID=UPI0014308CE2|nr:DUF262 domain-containing protein [Clavibacter michiganensis]QIT12487.1 DUF262 domain-containing protein [Clavibacter michiganensis subsp. michiganensis]